MVDLYKWIIIDTIIVETIVIVGFIIFFFPKMGPLWINGMFKPNIKILKDSRIRFFIEFNDYYKEQSVSRMLRFKDNVDKIKLDLNLHWWLFLTRSDNFNESRTWIVPFWFNTIRAYRSMLLSNIQEEISYNLEVNNIETIRLLTMDYNLKEEELSFEFKLPSVFEVMFVNLKPFWSFVHSVNRWGAICDGWHNVRVVSELFSKYGRIRVFKNGKLIGVWSSMLLVSMYDAENRRILKVGKDTADKEPVVGEMD